MITAKSAQAQCDQENSTVTCIGNIPGGFIAGEDALTIKIGTTSPGEEAFVDDGGVDNSTAVSTLDDATLTIAVGSEVTASGDGSTAVAGGATTEVTNHGLITAAGANARGASAGIDSRITNFGVIEGTGSSSDAVLLGSDSKLENRPGGLVENLTSGFAVLGNSGTNRVDNLGGATINGNVNLAGGDDEFIAYSGSTMNGTIDGGNGIDTFDLANGSAAVDTFDLDILQNFESFGVNGNDAVLWTLSGAASFSDGTVMRGGSVTFAPNTTLGGEFVMNAGKLDVDVAVEFTDGLSVTGGDVLFKTGADVTGIVDVSGGTFLARGVLRDDLLTSGDDTQLKGNASVEGSLSVTGGETTVQGASTVGGGLNVTGGTLKFEAGAAIEADVVVDGGALTLGGDASLEGSLAQNAGSTFTTQISSDGSNRRLDVKGSVAITDATLVLRAGAGDPFGAAQPFTILTTTSGISGEFSAIESSGPGTGFLALDSNYGPYALHVVAGLSYVEPARSPNQIAVGQHLDLANQGATSPDFQVYLDSLTELDTAGALEALDGLNPEVFDAHTSAALATGSTFANLLATRPIRCQRYASPHRLNEPSYAACSEQGFTGWATGFGLVAERDGRPGFADWTYGGGGLAFGADRELGDAFSISGMVGGSRTALDFDDRGDASMTTVDLGGALAWHHEGTRVRGVFEYGHGWHETRRRAPYASSSPVNTSEHDSDRITLLVEGGHEFQFGPIDVEPIAGFEYTYLNEGEANESTSSVTALAVSSRENVLIAGEIGLRVGTTLDKHGYLGDLLEWADGVWRPEFSARWRQVFSDYDRASSARLRAAPAGTPSFRTTSEDAQFGAELAAGVSFQPHGTRNTVHLGYESFVGNRTLVHTIKGTFRIPF